MKKKNVYVQGVFICIALAAVFILTGCSSAVKLTSDWKKSEIVIDGRPNDWDGSLYLLKKANVLSRCSQRFGEFVYLFHYERSIRTAADNEERSDSMVRSFRRNE